MDNYFLFRPFRQIKIHISLFLFFLINHLGILSIHFFTYIYNSSQIELLLISLFLFFFVKIYSFLLAYYF